MEKLLRSIWQDEVGQDLAEYAMLVVLIAVAVAAAVVIFGGELSAAFTGVSDTLFPLGGGDG